MSIEEGAKMPLLAIIFFLIGFLEVLYKSNK